MSSLTTPAPSQALALPLGAASSLALHAVLAAGVIWAVTPAPRAPQTVPEAELSIEAWEVPRSAASEATPEAEPAKQEAVAGDSLSGSLVRQDKARPVQTRAERAASPPAGAASVAAVSPDGKALRPGAPSASKAPEAALPADRAAAAATAPDLARAAEASAEPAVARQPDSPAAAAAEIQAQGIAAAVARPVSAAPARPQPQEIAATSGRPEPVTAQPAAAEVATAVLAEAKALPAARGEALRPSEAQIRPVAAVAAAPPSAALSPALPPPAAAVAATPPQAAALPATAPAASPALASAAPEAIAAPAARPGRDEVAAARIQGAPAPAQEPQAAPAPQARPETPVTFGAPPPAQPAPAQPPAAERGKAILAPIGPDGQLDAKSLAAIAALTAPADPGSAAAGLQDGLTGILSSIPCARIQMVFDPDTGDVVLRGNIPDASQAAAITGALVAQIGAGLPLRTDLRELPPPQCTVLAGLDALGLPQSTEQDTNDRILGPGGFALEQVYTGGQPLNLALQGADYPAWIYVDYFTADGQVLHLVPNDELPLTLVPPDAPYDALRQRNGRGPLGLVFGPPYGRELAVAYASSVPLYDGLRPLQEPAAPYLEFLSDRIAAARASGPGFKGEWVYFLISSQP